MASLEQHREMLKDLYLSKDWELSAIMKHMAEEYNLQAT